MAKFKKEEQPSGLSGRKTKKQFMFYAVFFLLGGASVWLWFIFFPVNGAVTAGQTSRPIRLGQNGLVNPLLDYATADNQFSELTTLSNDLNGQVAVDLQRGDATSIGIFFQDLNSGRWAGANPSGKFSPASLLKVPIMITYLKLAETQPDILNKSIVYDGSFDDNALEDIKPLKAIQVGHSYTVDDLLRYMIEYSDNNAIHLLFAMGVTTDQFDQTCTDLGIPAPSSTDDFVSPRLYSRFFRVLYNGTYLNQAMSQKALELLANADFPQGIMAGVPENVPVAQKFGEHKFVESGVTDTEELHDCGIVYYPGHPYVLCVMTKGADFTKLTSAISDISHLVWTKVDSGSLR